MYEADRFIGGQAARRFGVALCRFLSVFCALYALWPGALLAAESDRPSVAFYYGSDVPVEMLSQFDWAVVEADHVGATQLNRLQKYGTDAFAYVSVGEADQWRGDAQHVPAEALKARNDNWNSHAADLTNAAWTDYIVNKRIGPLWQQGYRGFFLDTLDSYRLFAKDEASVNAQQQALVALIKRLHNQFPGIKLLLNRGFEILDQVEGDIVGVAAESVYKSYIAGTDTYGDVSAEDSEWLMNQLQTVRTRYGLPAIAIDYVEPSDREQARATAQRIANAGLVPWVSNGALNQVGVGLIEPVPRKVLVVFDKREVDHGDFGNSNAHMYAAMPLEYLGYGAVYANVNAPLPSDTLVGRYAGIVSWFGQQAGSGSDYRTWLQRQVADGMRVAIFGDPGLAVSGQLASTFGVSEVGGISDKGLAVVSNDDMLGFEGMPSVPPGRESGFQVVDEQKTTAHLTVRDGAGHTFSPVVTGDWGGIAAAPWVLQQSLGYQERWILDPFKFLKTALALPDMPTPDWTTENGSRYWMTEVDGDAFNSRANFPGSPFNGQVLLDRILKKHRVPTTVSVITGEIGPEGLYPELTSQVEPIAREIFRLPWVEIGTHTFSHPFDWLSLKEGELSGEGRTAAGYGYNLPIKNYRFDLEKEIAGSTEYINEHLAPPGKRVKAVLWSGDSIPPEKAIAIADRLGIANINGGNTSATNNNPTLTQVSPMLRPFGDHIHVYSPQINENVYTNNMTAPLWGFRRVIETYKITDMPRRLKPIDIYFHFYSATFPASLKALNEVFAYAQSQETLPIYASTYSEIARNWYNVGLARRLDGGWQISGAEQMRTLRLPESMGWPDIEQSSGVVGVRDIPQGRYVALAGTPRVTLRLRDQRPNVPFIERSNGRIKSWQQSDGALAFELESDVVPLQVQLGGASGCSINSSGASRSNSGGGVTLNYKGTSSGLVRVSCGR